jgi:D-tyrosyl-tRNA(Tyr) deacylase
MRLVIQRVKKASVEIVEKKKISGEIGLGVFVLVGVEEVDTEAKADTLAEKLAKLRIMSDDRDKMNLSVKDVDAGVLVVSQFTLFADTTKGNRPSFIKAAKPGKAQRIYLCFVEKLKSLGLKVETGEFGEYMRINAVLDGPVTIVL